MPAKSQAVSSDEQNSISIDQLPPLPSSLMSIDPVGFDRYEEDRKEWWSRVLRQSEHSPPPESDSSAWTTGGIPKGGSDGDFHYRTDTNTIYYNKRGTWRALAPLSQESSDSSINSFHINNSNNPHRVTATHIGLDNVDNTSDETKPISTATQTALDGKASSSHTHQDATILGAGFMSISDKVALDSHLGVPGSSPAHPTATTSVAGFMSSSDKTKLDGMSGSGGGTSTGWSAISGAAVTGLSTLELGWNTSTYSMVEVFIGNLSGSAAPADFKVRFNYDDGTSAGAWANTVGGFINKISGTGTLTNMMNAGVSSGPSYVDLHVPYITGSSRVLEFTTYPWTGGTAKAIKYEGFTGDTYAKLSGFLMPAGYGPPQKIEISVSTGTFSCSYKVIGLP